MKPGILEIPAAEYHADPCDTPSLSASMAKILISQSPAHARAAHPRLNPDYKAVADDKFDLGNTVHALLLEGQSKVEVFDYENWRTQASQQAAALARQHGRIPMLGPQWDSCQAMVKAIVEQLATVDCVPIPFTDGMPEQTIIWDEDGVACRARLDWLHTGNVAVDDLKTTSRSANPERWSRTLFESNYDVQASMYRRAVRAVTGVTPEFNFVVVETSAPFALSVVSLTPEGWALADAKADYAINLWRECLTTDRWPAYPARVVYAEPPGWAEAQWLEKEAREAA